MLLLGTGCALFDPGASLSGRDRTAYDCIVNSPTFEDAQSVALLSGRVVSGDLYTHLHIVWANGRQSFDLYRVFSTGYAEVIPITIYTLTESNYCLAEGYLSLNSINDALSSYYGSPMSGFRFDFDFGGEIMAIFISIVSLVIVLCLNGLLASKASDMAKDKGYDKRTWFHMCFWLGVLSYIIVAAMPDLTMHRKSDQTNKLLEDLLKAQTTNAVVREKAQQADVATFLPEL